MIMTKLALEVVCFKWVQSVSNHCFVLQDPAVALAKKGYHVLLEKPMAVSVFLPKGSMTDSFKTAYSFRNEASD